jgi:hypothetical protein
MWGGAVVLAGLMTFADETKPDLNVALGERNEGVGLKVPSVGDGLNEAETVQGAPVRRVVGAGSLYFYVAIDHPAYRQGPVDLYVSAEVFDDGVARVSMQYDRAAERPNIGTYYTAADNAYLLVGSGGWRTLHFFLPQTRLGHGQNGGADFRFTAPGVAFRKIAASVTRPANFDVAQTLDAEALRSVAVTRGPGMELTYGNDAGEADAALFKALSVSSVESYVDWAGVEPVKDQWDWSKWDKQVATLKGAGLKWVPFLIAGPVYATPLWFQDSPDSHVYRCLEHGKDSRVQSLFNPALRPQIGRFLRAFAERYRDTGAIESVLLGVTGIYGESIYPAGPEGGWTARLTGEYHNHHGWWAGDAYAVSAFRAAMNKKYGRVKRLNAAWGTAYASFDDVSTFLPDRAPSDRARADFVEWYQASMTEWAVFWVKSCRKVFPKTEIYLCTGGDGSPFLGADFTAQTAAIARYGAGVRITNEGSDYAHNFSITREVGTATRHYGTFCGFEPASKVNSNGVVARIYNATASGARQLHDYIPNTLGQGAAALNNFRTNAVWLTPRRPRVPAALYLSRETWALEPGAVDRTLTLSRTLRDATDLDFVTRRSLADGHLRGYRTLVLSASSVLEPESAEAIERWVRKGGILVAATRPGETLGSRLYDQSAWRMRLFSDAVPGGSLLRPTLADAAPAHWTLKVGSREDEAWLVGDWNGREQGREWSEIAGATMRWSGARPGVWLPVTPGAEHTLRLSLSVPEQALGATGLAVTVNGQPVGRIAKAGRQECAFAVSAAVLGSNAVARLELAVTAWNPAVRQPGNRDARDLGVSVRQVEVVRAGAEGDAATSASLRMVVDRARLASQVREVGKGRTAFLPGVADDASLVAGVLAALMPNAVDGRLDGRFATETDDGVLWFDAAGSRISR